MRHFACIVTTCALLGTLAAPLSAGELDPTLQRHLAQTQDHEVVSALVYLVEQGDVPALVNDLKAQRASREDYHREIVRHLRDTAAMTQGPVLAELEARRGIGQVREIEAFWIANIIRVDATADVLRQIAAREDVLRVYRNARLEGIEPIVVDETRGTQSGNTLAGLAAVKAPEVWNMGYTGEGILVATIDSGVDGDHPALESRWRGNDPAYAGNPHWAWFDPHTHTDFPVEFADNSHGTHTMGTILGGAPGDEIGVAPDAQWIQAAVVDRGLGGGIHELASGAIAAFQWMAAPTGNPGDTWAVPRVCSNSWGILHTEYPVCDETFYQWIDNCEAAGTAHFFAAGNEGHWNQPLRRPADRATTEYQSVAIGAIDPHDPNWPLGYFSSTGPTNCTPDGSEAIKPDLAAPGWNIRSSINGGGYTNYAGTSMAAPHVGGVAALMLDACESLTPDELKQILYDTAIDLGEPGKDNEYGWGMIDALAAVNLALDRCSLGISVENQPTIVPPGQPTSFSVQVDEANESVVPGSEVLMYRVDDGPYTAVPLTPLGDGAYEATVPSASCGHVVEYYVRVQGDEGTIRTSPHNAPQFVYSSPVGERVVTQIHQERFTNGMPAGWTASELWNVTYYCSVADPCDGNQWAYYGDPQTCNFGTSTTSGEMVSAPIQLPSGTNIESVTLSFCYLFEGRSTSSRDIASFGIVGQGTRPLSLSPDDWQTHTVDLTDQAGEAVQLRWHFDSVTPPTGEHLGWQVDNVRIAVTTFECVAPPCVSDLTGDSSVDVSDLLVLLGAWGPCNNCPADLDGNAVVDVSDLLILLAAWGPC